MQHPFFIIWIWICVIVLSHQNHHVNEIEFCLFQVILGRLTLKIVNFFVLSVAVKGAGITEFDSSDDSQPSRMQNQQNMSIYQSQQNQHNQQIMYGQGNRQSQHGMQQIISQQQQDNQYCDDTEQEFRVKFVFNLFPDLRLNFSDSNS